MGGRLTSNGKYMILIAGSMDFASSIKIYKIKNFNTDAGPINIKSETRVNLPQGAMLSEDGKISNYKLTVSFKIHIKTENNRVKY